MNLKKHNFYGLDISVFTNLEIRSYLIDRIENNNKAVIYGYSFGSIAYMIKHEEIYKFGNKSEVILIDGRLFYLFLKLNRVSVKSDISIPQIVNLSLDLANQNSYKVLLFGSTQDNNDEATRNIQAKYSNIKISKGLNGFYKVGAEKQIVKKINEIKPDILLVGISTPIKERFSFENKERLNVKVIILCGGMIDVLSGRSNQSGGFIKKIGLASLYRLMQEPRRLYKRYFFIYGFIFFNFLPVFIWNVIFLRKKTFNIPEYYNLSE